MDFAPLGSHPLRLDFVRPAPPKTGAYQNLVFFGVIALGIVQGIFLGFRFGGSVWALGIGAIIGAATGVWLARWLRARATKVVDKVPPIELRRDRVLLPPSANSDQQVELLFDDIEILSLTPGQRGSLVIAGDRQFHRYYLSAFVRPDLVPAFVHAMKAALRAHGGNELMLHIRASTEDLGRFMKRRTPVTYGMMGVLIAVFFLQRMMNGTGFGADAAQVMARLGANVRPLVEQGQWWRLFTANFLHGFTLHIVMNGLALLSLGLVVERIVGSSRFLIIYLVSAVAGSMASTLLSGGFLSVGASTAVFGLLGSFAVLSLAHRKHLPAGIGQSLRWWVIILGINFSLPLIVKVVDGWAHFGGFLAGVLVTAAVYPMQGRLQFSLPDGLGLRAAMFLLVGINLYAGNEAFKEARSVDHYPVLVTETLRVQRERAEAEAQLTGTQLETANALNEQAWNVATSTSATRAELERAVLRAEMANEKEPLNGAILDTVATARYRVGDFDGAVSAELQSIDAVGHEALWEKLATKAVRLLLEQGDTRNIHGSQLVRFSRAQTATTAAYVVVPENDGLTIKGPPGRMWFAVERGSKTLGMVQAYLHDDSLTLTPSDLLADHLNEGPVELVVLGSTTTMGSLTDVDPPWEFIAWDPEVEELP